jgi:hypothetical protein
MNLIQHIDKSIELAEKHCSKLCQAIMEYDGMSGYKTRHLFNNLCNIEGITYCEVGTYKGASSSSAIFNNKINGIFIDNWSIFGENFNVNGQNNKFSKTKDQFLYNLSLACKYSTTPPLSITILEDDYRNITLPQNTKLDVYFYDGHHSEENQKNGIKHFYNNFNNEFILIIDDFWDKEEAGNENTKIITFETIKELNLKIKYHRYLKGYVHDNVQKKMETYWNGLGIFLLEK